MKIQHLHLHVRDREVAVAFYRKWLNLQIARSGKAITFLADEQGFDLALMQDDNAASMPSWFHLGSRLESSAAVLQLHDAMVAAGVEIAKAPYVDGTLASFRARDPDGYAIEFYWESDNAPVD